MKALYFPQLNKYELREVRRPELQSETDVIIKVSLTTICGSDIHLIHGIIPSTPGYVLGHEYVGVVEQAGRDVRSFKPGDRVTGPPVPFCGYCANCLEGNKSHCTNAGIHGSGRERGGLSGTHAEYIRVPHADACLAHIPEALTDEQVMFVSDILSTGYSAVERAGIKPGDAVAVFGAGPVGLCAIACARLSGASRVIAVGRADRFRLEMAKTLGATDIICASCQEPALSIYELTKGKGADAAIEASGSEAAIQQAVRGVKINGAVSLVGISGTPVSIPLHEVFYRNININMGLADTGNIKRLMTLIESGQLDLLPLITHRMGLNEIERAVDIFEKRDENVIKIVIKP